jgi:hypothetical protein
MSADLNKLIGIPFKLNRRDFGGCDCRGIVWLYHKYVNGKEYPFTDGKNIRFRDRKKDISRWLDVLNTFASPVKFEELNTGDIVIIKDLGIYGALGVCINEKQMLHMDKFVGSCLTQLKIMKDFFVIGYRPNV